MKTKPKTENKNYEVRIIAFATVLVIAAENEEKALEYATDECSFGDLQMDEARIERVVGDNELENAKRHADCIAEDPDADEDDEG